MRLVAPVGRRKDSPNRRLSRLHSNKVTDVVTFGSPVDSSRINPAINTLELQHTSDIVPRLDLEDASIVDVVQPFYKFFTQGVDQVVGWATGAELAPNRTTVTMPNPANPLNVFANHDHQEYSNSVLESQDADLKNYESSLRQRGFLVGDGIGGVSGEDEARVSACDIQVGRKG